MREGKQIQRHWERSNEWNRSPGGRSSTSSGRSRDFQERHYNEFVTFLPYVQRFLYGEGQARRRARAHPRVPARRCRQGAHHVPDRGPSLEVAHVDLYFFFDIDIVILAFEVYADDLRSAARRTRCFASAALSRLLGTEDGRGGHCPAVEWLSTDGTVLAVSDYEKREKYLAFVCRHRPPCFASHWEWLLEPLVLHHQSEAGPDSLSADRIPSHATDGLSGSGRSGALTRAEFVRLGLAASPGTPDSLPYSERHLRDFEERYCYDRYWNGQDRDRPGTRFMCNGRTFTMVSDCSPRVFVDRKTDLEQFRHEYFLLFLCRIFIGRHYSCWKIAWSMRMNRLDISNPQSVRQFRRVIRQALGVFLRFTQRYWFHEVSDHTQAKELFHMISEHLGTARLYAEVRTAIEDMNQFLDSDALRRQGETMVRLTVVTTFGLIGVTTMSFLGMNLLAAAESSLLTKVATFSLSSFRARPSPSIQS